MGVEGAEVLIPSHSSICALARKTSPAQVYGADAAGQILRYGAPIGCHIERYPRLPRCMDRLRNLVAQSSSTFSPATGTVVRADELTGSSGRFGRLWHAPAGGLYFGFLWADTFLPEFSRLVPFAVGIACCETVRSYGVEAYLKWVNDVHVRGKKIVGVLSEMVTGKNGERFHLVGVGMNVNNTIFPEELVGQATALKTESGVACDLDEVCTLLLARLQWNFGLLCYVEKEALAGALDETSSQQHALLRRWSELSDIRGRNVLYGYDVQKKPLYRAQVMDIDESGGLVMQLEDGARITEYSGEILYLTEA